MLDALAHRFGHAPRRGEVTLRHTLPVNPVAETFTSPVHSTIVKYAALAQSAERLTRNEKVIGSIPIGGSSDCHSATRPGGNFSCRTVIPAATGKRTDARCPPLSPSRRNVHITDIAAQRRAQRFATNRSPQVGVARQAIREYIEGHSRAEVLDQVLDEELPRYAEALERLGQ